MRDVEGRPAELTPEMIFKRTKTVTLPQRFDLRAGKSRNREKDTGHYAQMESDYLIAKALDKPIPKPLASLPPGQVTQIPQCGGYVGKDGPDAACGAAKTQYFTETQMTGTVRKLSWCMYGWAAKRTISSGNIDVSNVTPGKYELHKVCDTVITRCASVEIDTW